MILDFSKRFTDVLELKGYSPQAVSLGQDAIELMAVEDPIVAIVDLRLGDMSGIEVLREISSRWPKTACILLTGFASQESAIEAVNLGAYSYFQKPVDVDQLLLSIRRAIEIREAEDELREYRENLEELVEDRTHNLEIMVKAMTGREVRMAELKMVIKKLRAQIIEAGMEPVADDPLFE